MNLFNPSAKEAFTSRLVRPRNAPAQVVSMETGWWKCLDWMITERDESLAGITEYCWQYCDAHPDSVFAGIFNYYVHWLVANRDQAFFNIANDNYALKLADWNPPPHFYRTRLTKHFSFCLSTDPRDRIEGWDSHHTKHLGPYLTRFQPATLSPINENSVGREDVWDKLPRRNYKIKMTRNFPFLAG